MSKTGTPWELMQWLRDQPQDKLFTVKEKREKRSLTQNAYYWVLVNKLARKLRISDTEVHRWMLREYGVCAVVTLLKRVPIEQYFKYYDVYKQNDTYNYVKVYMGSSKMDSGEFSGLLEGIRYECEEQGIDVLTPSEIASLEFVENFGED